MRGVGSEFDNPSQGGSGLSIFWYRNIQVDVPDSLAFVAAFGVAWRGSLALGGGLEVIARLGDQCLARLCKSRRRGLWRRFLAPSESLTALSGAGGVFGGSWRALAESLAALAIAVGVFGGASWCLWRSLWRRFLVPLELAEALAACSGL